MTEPQRGFLHVELRQRAPIPLDVTLSCAAGELLALVGPSGSGKTTVLRAIAGLVRPDHGSISCNGERWLDRGRGVDHPPHRRSVGLVFQNYALFPHMSALDNVRAALGHMPPESRARRARELLAQVHLEGLEERVPSQLSGGQQQRVAVARALARDPAVLLLDEPFSAVDQVTRGKLQRELARLRVSLNIPVLMVTHDLDEARMLADRIVILHHGSTLQAGTPEEVMTRPRSVSVARLVQLTNLFEGVLQAPPGAGGKHLLAWLDYSLEVDDPGGFVPGDKVCWVIPPQHVILHQRVRPSRGERENPVAGVVRECTPLGETTTVTLLVNEDRRYPLELSVPSHVAQRNHLAAGERIGVSLLAGGIHLMPWEPLGMATGE
ncbi:MAG: ABC transporter ATP-binding protein [Pseudomonadota bacterium]